MTIWRACACALVVGSGCASHTPPAVALDPPTRIILHDDLPGDTRICVPRPFAPAEYPLACLRLDQLRQQLYGQRLAATP